MSYTWKTLQEVGWAIVVAGITYLAAAVNTGLPVDKAAWLALAAGLGRAVLAAIVAFVSKTGSFTTS